MNKVKIGIIGCGVMGKKHCRFLTEGKITNAALVAVADTNPLMLDEAKEIAGDGLLTFSSAKELIDSKSVDAIIIATPHYYHPVYAIMGLEAGLNVLVEKPAGVYTKQVEKMNEAAKKSDKVFAVMFNQRTNPLYRKVKELVEQGKVGEIKRTNWIITDWYRSQSYYDQGGWRATWKGEGGGVLLNQNPHNLDLWQWICGKPTRAKSVVYYGKHRDIEVEDDVTCIVEYENGASGSYTTTVADVPGTNRLEVTGTKGKIVVEEGKINFWELAESEPEFNKRYKKGLGKPEFTKREIVTEGEYTSHVGITQNFCDAILDNAELISPGEEGIHSLEISNAIHLSSWKNGDWVEIPVNKQEFYDILCEKAGTKELV